MDWARAIEINHSALNRIVAALIAMVGLAGGSSAARLSQAVYRAVVRVLGPAESAVRRLIIIAARGLVVKLPPSRPKPAGRITGKGKGGTRGSFQLFDSRKRFSHERRRRSGPKVKPRILLFDVSPLSPLFRPAPQPAAAPTPEPDGTVSAARLWRRLMAIKAALDDLPHQARRLARWQARRNLMPSPKFRSPLRPGRAPGQRRKPKHEVDHVLTECHGLAWDAHRVDSS